MEEELRRNGARIEIMTGDWISYRVFDGGDYGEWIELDSYRDLEQTLRKIIKESKKEDANKPCYCKDPDYAYYRHSSSGCLTIIHGAAECSECGEAWKATQEGSWTIHFDRPAEIKHIDPITRFGLPLGGRNLSSKRKKEIGYKPCDCEDPDYAYYWYSSSGCSTVIHGSAECSECGRAWDATQEGNWTIHFDRPTEDPSTG